MHKELQRYNPIEVGAEQTVTAPMIKRHELRAQLRDMQKRGEIAEAYDWEESGNEISVKVKRIKYPRPPWPRYIFLGAGAVLIGASVGALLWQSRYILLIMVGLSIVASGVGHAITASPKCACILHGPNH